MSLQLCKASTTKLQGWYMNLVGYALLAKRCAMNIGKPFVFNNLALSFSMLDQAPFYACLVLTYGGLVTPWMQRRLSPS